jgi:hypothetical protein
MLIVITSSKKQKPTVVKTHTVGYAIRSLSHRRPDGESLILALPEIVASVLSIRQIQIRFAIFPCERAGEKTNGSRRGRAVVRLAARLTAFDPP